MKKSKLGFTLVEIMIVVAIIGLLAAIAIPAFMKNRTLAQKNACINNIRMIDAAKEQWAMEVGKVDADSVVTASVNAYIKNNTTPACPVSGTAGYTYQNVGTKPTCAVSSHTGY